MVLQRSNFSNCLLLISSFTESIAFDCTRICGTEHVCKHRRTLLILLRVFDIGSLIALLYLPYSLRVGYSSRAGG
ncbi:hypothetical protein ABFX02_08G218100 [Erythranthe guttata]